MIETVYTDDVCSISFDPGIPCIELTWHGYATSKQFRQIAEQQLAAMQAKQVSKVLDDHQHMLIVCAEDQQWVMADWLPRALAAGYQALAIIPSDDYFNKVATQNVVSQIQRDVLEIRHFQDREDAKAWLKTF